MIFFLFLRPNLFSFLLDGPTRSYAYTQASEANWKTYPKSWQTKKKGNVNISTFFYANPKNRNPGGGGEWGGGELHCIVNLKVVLLLLMLIFYGLKHLVVKLKWLNHYDYAKKWIWGWVGNPLPQPPSPVPTHMYVCN